MRTTAPIGRRIAMPVAGLIAVVAATLLLAFAGVHEGEAATGHGHGGATAMRTTTARQAAFHDAMRKLWEDHITWTRLAIVSFAADLPDLQATEARLMRNQVDIGDAIKPYYGTAAGNRLTVLLKEHIAGAVALMQAAKTGDQPLVKQRTDEWYVNGNQIADFLAKANPRNWPRATMRQMMKGHLDMTLQEAVNRLNGRFDADVRDYDAVHRHILRMADALSAGIMKQFPRRFR